jgi:hypothetical protein
MRTRRSTGPGRSSRCSGWFRRGAAALRRRRRSSPAARPPVPGGQPRTLAGSSTVDRDRLRGRRRLDDERFGPLGIRDREPESYRAAVVLHDEGVPGQPDSLAEIAEHRGQVVEGVRELGVPGCITVPEPGVVRCDQAERVGEPIQQWLPHAGRGGESVQEQDRGRILRSGLAIEDRQAVDVDGAVRRAMEFAGGLGIHSDVSAGVLDGQWAGTQSPCGSVVWPTSIR